MKKSDYGILVYLYIKYPGFIVAIFSVIYVCVSVRGRVSEHINNEKPNLVGLLKVIITRTV